MLEGILLMAFQALWFILPAYLANSTPVVAGGGTPIDFGKTMPDGEPMLGKGKTWRGAFAGIAMAILISEVQILVQNRIDLSAYGLIKMSLELGFLLGTGTIIGDAVKSFFKRRMKIKSGAEWPVIDQLDFIAGALLFSMILPGAAAYLNWKIVAFLVVFTPLIHRASNIFAFRTHLKKVPW